MKNTHKLVYVLAIFLTIVSWLIAIFYWDKLPNIIPTHFGVSGAADNWENKSFFVVFLIPILQTLMTAGFVFLYYRPQYSDMPTTLLLMAMEEKKREKAFSLIRTMLVVVTIAINILFSYITFGMNYSATNKGVGLNPYLLFGIIGAMLIWLTYWTFKVYKVTREIIKEKQ